MVTATETVEPTDEALMAMLRNGDDVALAGLMTRWEVPLKRFLLRLGIATADAEDLAQETFVRIFQTRDRYRPGSRFKPWLLTIAGNLARNAHRWKRRHPTDSMDAVTEDGGLGAWSDRDGARPDERAANVSVAETVRGAVMALAPALRDSVVLVDLEDLSYAEAAQVLNCSVKSVETRLYRARNQLRDALGPQREEISSRAG